jgi:peptidylprolyl isomerase
MGDTVRVHYTGRLEDGTIFDSTLEREPYEIKIGSGRSTPGFEKGIEGMTVGEKKTFEVSPEMGFGERNAALTENLKIADLPKNIEFEVGKQLQIPNTYGGFFRATIIEIGKNEITVDLNHPLAGQKLEFEVELLEIIDEA